MSSEPVRRPDVAELDRTELEEAIEALGARRFHARQLFRWVYRKGETDFGAMTDLGRSLRDTLATGARLSTPAVVERDVSTDGTTKFVLALAVTKQRFLQQIYFACTPVLRNAMVGKLTLFHKAKTISEVLKK